MTEEKKEGSRKEEKKQGSVLGRVLKGRKEIREERMGEGRKKEKEG